MKKTLKKYFIPHRANNFHPHILHTKRAIFYSLIFLCSKIIIVLFAVLLPVGVFVLPDVLAEQQKQIVALTNKARAEKNLPPLAMSGKLETSAQYKADDMSQKQYFAHTNNKKGLSGWLRDAGYAYHVAGENLAVGFSSAEEVVNAWKNSPTHYANLVDADFTELGIGLSGGVYNGRATVFIAQHLAEPFTFAVIEKPAVKKIEKKSFVAEVKTVNIADGVSSTPVASETVSSSVLSAREENVTEDQDPAINIDAQTPIEKYIQAKNLLPPLTNIFAVSQTIYFIAMMFFAGALMLSIATHVRKKRYHIIAQTSGLIALLFVFWRF